MLGTRTKMLSRMSWIYFQCLPPANKVMFLSVCPQRVGSLYDVTSCLAVWFLLGWSLSLVPCFFQGYLSRRCLSRGGFCPRGSFYNRVSVRILVECFLVLDLKLLGTFVQNWTSETNLVSVLTAPTASIMCVLKSCNFPRFGWEGFYRLLISRGSWIISQSFKLGKSYILKTDSYGEIDTFQNNFWQKLLIMLPRISPAFTCLCKIFWN